jgi:hypothetical protein
MTEGIHAEPLNAFGMGASPMPSASENSVYSTADVREGTIGVRSLGSDAPNVPFHSSRFRLTL